MKVISNKTRFSFFFVFFAQFFENCVARKLSPVRYNPAWLWKSECYVLANECIFNKFIANYL